MKSVLKGVISSLLLVSSVSAVAESVNHTDSLQSQNDSITQVIPKVDTISKASKRSVLEFSSPKKNFKFVPYGFIRNDFFYDSRQNFETASGLFYIIPKDLNLNQDNQDINDIPSSSFLSIASRLGVKVYGPEVFKAKSYAQIETDFAGYSGSTTMLRIRQAFCRLDWKNTSLLMGQTWHPMFGEVVPTIQSLATGSPFQPFNRSPQVRIDWRAKNAKFYLSALYQFQYSSIGPNGSSPSYLVNSKIPELYVGFDWRENGWLFGAGLDYLQIRPRVFAPIEIDGVKTNVKVDEKLGSWMANAFLQYVSPNKKISFKAKTIFGENMSHLLMLSGYGVSRELSDGSFEYTNLKNSTSWVNFVYGDKWQIGLFCGYMKNLGSDDSLMSESTTFVFGYNNLDYVYRLSPMLCYNLKYFSLGVEYELTTAAYGDLNLETGKVINPHEVTNHRIVGVLMFHF